MPRSVVVILVLLLGYAGLCGALYLFQRSLIYFPRARSLGEGASALLLRTEAGNAVVTVRRLDGPAAVIYFGGNAEDVSVNLDEFSTAFPDHAIYLLHYRGYGGSAGSPSEAGIVADGIALFDTVNARHSGVAVIGRSLGAGVAVQVAARRPVARLILVTPFEHLADVAAAQYFFVPVRWLLRDTYDSGLLAPQVSAPVLLIAADADEVVPRASTESLLARFRPGVAALRVIPGTGHNSLGGPAYLRLMNEFLGSGGRR